VSGVTRLSVRLRGRLLVIRPAGCAHQVGQSLNVSFAQRSCALRRGGPFLSVRTHRCQSSQGFRVEPLEAAFVVRRRPPAFCTRNAAIDYNVGAGAAWIEWLGGTEILVRSIGSAALGRPRCVFYRCRRFMVAVPPGWYFPGALRLVRQARLRGPQRPWNPTAWAFCPGRAWRPSCRGPHFLLVGSPAARSEALLLFRQHRVISWCGFWPPRFVQVRVDRRASPSLVRSIGCPVKA